MSTTKQIVVKRVKDDPLYIDLAKWFYTHPDTDIIHKDLIVRQIDKLRGPAKRNEPVKYTMYLGLINQCRIYLEEHHQISLISVRQPGEKFSAYKITNEAEGTYIGIRTGKDIMDAMKRFRRRLPMIKKKFVYPSLKLVFGEAQAEIIRFRSLSERFLVGYQEGHEAEKAKLNEKEGKDNGEKG